jgi:hypothetical protein
MPSIRFHCAAVALLFASATGLAGSAAAQTNVPLAHFTSVELRGGGHVTLHHGAQQRVLILKGSTQFTRLAIDTNDKLVIDTCNEECPQSYSLEIDITSPDVDAASIEGGGKIDAQGAFPQVANLSAAIEGGGAIDVRAMTAQSANAAISGGGDIKLTVKDSLTSAVDGGGKITYWGNPSVRSAVNGGGDIRKGSN